MCGKQDIGITSRDRVPVELLHEARSFQAHLAGSVAVEYLQNPRSQCRSVCFRHAYHSWHVCQHVTYRRKIRSDDWTAATERFHEDQPEALLVARTGLTERRNERSGRLLERLGFEKEGYAKRYLKIDGLWEDHVLTAKVRTQG